MLPTGTTGSSSTCCGGRPRAFVRCTNARETDDFDVGPSRATASFDGAQIFTIQSTTASYSLETVHVWGTFCNEHHESDTRDVCTRPGEVWADAPTSGGEGAGAATWLPPGLSDTQILPLVLFFPRIKVLAHDTFASQLASALRRLRPAHHPTTNP